MDLLEKGILFSNSAISATCVAGGEYTAAIITGLIVAVHSGAEIATNYFDGRIQEKNRATDCAFRTGYSEVVDSVY